MLQSAPSESTRVQASTNRGVAVVTGGRRGIGGATCRLLAQTGFDVAVLDIVNGDDGNGIVAEVKELGRRAKFYNIDISDLASHASVVEAIAGELGDITCLVNNAGIQVPVRRDILEETPEAFDKVVGVNLRGTFFFTQAVARHMVGSGTPSVARNVVFITSANAQMASPEKSSYCTSKSALSMVSKLFALRLAEENIWVHEIRPGLIQTDMTAEVTEKYSKVIAEGASPIKRWGQPEDIAQCVTALATRSLGFTTGDVFHIGGGLHIERL